MLRIVLIALAALLLAGPARAHHARPLSEAEKAGVAIANLTHGQMRVMAGWRAPILALAATVFRPDWSLHRLLVHEEIQFHACAFGLMPGAITDEASPFNECSHAYLATDLEILRRLTTSEERGGEARALMDKVSLDMATNADALLGCQYSGESFNTASTVYPDFAGIPRHWPSALVALGLLFGVAGVARFAWRLDRRLQVQKTPPRAQSPQHAADRAGDPGFQR
jgi:hypothetical protein